MAKTPNDAALLIAYSNAVSNSHAAIVARVTRDLEFQGYTIGAKSLNRITEKVFSESAKKRERYGSKGKAELFLIRGIRLNGSK